MQLIILPLTVREKAEQQVLLRRAVELAGQIRDSEQQLFALSGILTFADKIIEPEYAVQVKEWIEMTKVAQLFEEEKLEAVRKVEAEKEEILKTAEAKVLALKLLLKGEEIEVISRATGLTLSELEEIQK